VVATTSLACGVARADAVHASFTTPSGRTFHVWGPKGYDPTKTYPVVMVFHGWQATGETFQAWFEMEKYVQNEAFVVYLDGVGGVWDVVGAKDLVFFDEVIKQLGETYCINPSRVLGFGFSYGGHFADHLGCKRAGYVKAITVGDGGPGGNRLHCGRLPVLVTTRTHDTNEYPAYGVDVAAGWTGLNKCGPAGERAPQTNSGNGENMGYCVTHAGCKDPGSLIYCEDTSTFAAGTPVDWNHTVREYYRAFAFKWFQALP
jgi:polyhydroxybutyrate depolymerase